jgi:NitT/TauT family transport system permease protein
MRSNRIILFVIVLTVLIVWQVAASRSFFVTLLISSPIRLASYFSENHVSLLGDLGHTVSVASGGLLLALLIGTCFGLIGLKFERTAWFLEGGSTIAQAIPLVVFAPFLIMLFGVGYASQIALASIMALFPWIIGLMSSMKGSKAEYDELLNLYEVPFWRRVLEVYIRHSLPNLVASIRVSSALAILGAVIAEFTGSSAGLGRNIFLGTVRLDPELIMSALVMTSTLGIIVHLALSYLEKKAGWWR